MKEAAATTVLAFKDSGLFPHVLIGNQNADYQVDLILTGTRQYNAPMVRLSNITLWLIPHTVTNTIQLQMTIQDKQGMILGKLKTSDQERKINGLLLLPFFPLLMFINDPGGWDTLIYNAVQAGIIEANQKAIF
ncbi:MAG: hypothetical protein NPIRA04_00470 [Nitrospirales bacterium]|nr:MAG: hypothetical protein NPIRA04_00470 [Nitrospirales bacterium]